MHEENIGLEATMNNLKCILYFNFDDINQNSGTSWNYKKTYYIKNYHDILDKFDESILK